MNYIYLFYFSYIRNYCRPSEINSIYGTCGNGVIDDNEDCDCGSEVVRPLASSTLIVVLILAWL